MSMELSKKRRRVSMPNQDGRVVRASKSAELIDKENRKHVNIPLGESNDTTALPAMKKRRGSIIVKDRKERKSIGRRVSFSHTVDVRLIKAAEEEQKMNSKRRKRNEPAKVVEEEDMDMTKPFTVIEYKEEMKGDSDNSSNSHDMSSDDMDMTANITQGTIILGEDGTIEEDNGGNVTIHGPVNMDLTANLTEAINSIMDDDSFSSVPDFGDDDDFGNMTIHGPVNMELTANLTQAIIEAGYDMADEETEDQFGDNNVTVMGQANMDLTANHTQFLIEEADSVSSEEDKNDQTIHNMVNMDMTVGEVSFDDFLAACKEVERDNTTELDPSFHEDMTMDLTTTHGMIREEMPQLELPPPTITLSGPCPAPDQLLRYLGLSYSGSQMPKKDLKPQDRLKNEVLLKPETTQKTMACVELKKMIDDRRKKIQQLSKKQESVFRNSAMIEDIYEYASAKADVKLTEFVQRVKGDVKSAQRESFEDFKGHVGTLVDLVNQHEKALAMYQETLCNHQDTHSVTIGSQPWKPRVMKGNMMVFEFNPIKPLVKYTLEIQLRQAETPDEIEDVDEASRQNPIFSSTTKASKPKKPRVVTSATIKQAGEIKDKLALGLWNSISLQELVEESLFSSLDLSRTLEEMCFRQKRIEQLLREVNGIERKLSNKCKVQRDGGQTNGRLEITFTLLDTRNKFVMVFDQLHFGYPFGDLKWEFSNIFGTVTEEIVRRVINACPKGFGYLTAICEALTLL